MGKEIEHYSKKLCRQGNDETTTRHIVVKENSAGIHVITYEVGPVKDKDGNTIGYDFYPVLRKRYLTLEEGISAAEATLQSGLNSGFREVTADTSDES